jgi:hypothetical protein
LQISLATQHGSSRWTGVILVSIFSVALLMGSAKYGRSTEGLALQLTVRRTKLYGVLSGYQRLGRVRPLLRQAQTEVSLSTEKQLVVRQRVFPVLCIHLAGLNFPCSTRALAYSSPAIEALFSLQIHRANLLRARGS